MSGRPIIIHDLAQANAALAAAEALSTPVVVRSAPGAAASLGAAVFRDIVTEARKAHPAAQVTAVLDCGGDAGHALNALRHGIGRIRVRLRTDVRARILDIAAQSGATVEDAGDEQAALDLLDAEDAYAEARAWLERD
ncbi:MAG: hypothetical protein EXQ86_07500 [Rhodospirillales bacterium]|nr:hypothetical protein [Rhodospirillales bacterium]